eukprot:jgi/Chlat1/4110/Chrsp26S04137
MAASTASALLAACAPGRMPSRNVFRNRQCSHALRRRRVQPSRGCARPSQIKCAAGSGTGVEDVNRLSFRLPSIPAASSSDRGVSALQSTLLPCALGAALAVRDVRIDPARLTATTAFILCTKVAALLVTCQLQNPATVGEDQLEQDSAIRCQRALDLQQWNTTSWTAVVVCGMSLGVVAVIAGKKIALLGLVLVCFSILGVVTQALHSTPVPTLLAVIAVAVCGVLPIAITYFAQAATFYSHPLLFALAVSLGSAVAAVQYLALVETTHIRDSMPAAETLPFTIKVLMGHSSPHNNAATVKDEGLYYGMAWQMALLVLSSFAIVPLLLCACLYTPTSWILLPLLTVPSWRQVWQEHLRDNRVVAGTSNKRSKLLTNLSRRRCKLRRALDRVGCVLSPGRFIFPPNWAAALAARNEFS